METKTSPLTNEVVTRIDEAELRSQVLTNLLRVSTLLVRELELPALLDVLARQVVDVVPSIQASILWIHDRGRGTLHIRSMHGLELGEQAATVRDLQLRSGEGLVGAALQRGEPLLIEGRWRYRDMTGEVRPRNQEGIRLLMNALPREITAVLLPLRIGSEIIGVLELLNLGYLPPLRRQDLQALQTFANLAAGAIKNAQLHAEMTANKSRLEAFGAIGTAVSTAADLEELISNVLDVILKVVDARGGALLLLDRGRSTLTVAAQRSLPQSWIAAIDDAPIAGAICEEAVRYGQPVRRPLLPETAEESLLAAGLQSGVYLPLLAGGTVVGVVCLFGDGQLYERVDVQSLMTMGSLIGFAIANVVLYEDSQTERRKLTATINSITEGVALIDGEGRLVLANEMARSLLSLEKVPYHQPLSEMPDFYSIRDLEGNALPVEQMPLARALSGEVFHDLRVLIRGASGQDTVMSFSGGPVYRPEDSAIEGAVVVFRDVTSQQKLERAKDDFLAVAAHELRSPLAAVRSYTDLLLRREQARDEQSGDLRGLTILGQQVSHMLRMVDNLLDVSRLDADQISLHLQPTNLTQLAEQVLEQQRPTAGDRELLLESDRRELLLVCDQLRVRQVLTNLVSNAIRYSPPGSAVCVTLSLKRRGELAARCPELLEHRAGDDGAPAPDEHALMALIEVEDEGGGISEEQQGRLFKRYARGRERRGEGLGLGLYLSREFVTRHNGAIWAESHPGQGSTFSVALPLDLKPDQI